MTHPVSPAAPDCPGPDPYPHGPSAFRVPPRAVDTHAHVIGSSPPFTFMENRTYTPPPASLAAYEQMLNQTGVAYGVLVQISVHGTDNRLMFEALKSNRERLRGVAVMPLALPESEYRHARESGVVGLRLNVLYGGGVGLNHLQEYGALAREMGWHLQLLLDARTLPTYARVISRLPVPVVFDHMGHFPARLGCHEPGFQTLLGLVADGAWVKLSAAYRLDSAPPPYTSAAPLAGRLLDIAPARCVWGSDWPHVGHWGVMPNVGDLLDALFTWACDESLLHRILVDNPTALYGFPSVVPRISS